MHELQVLLAVQLLLPGQRHACCLAPQVFQCVVAPCFGIEEVNDDGAVVEQNPPAFVVALDAHSPVAKFLFEHPVNLLADGMQLAATVARHEHELVEFGGQAAHIGHDDVLASVVLGSLSVRQSEVVSRLLSRFICGGSLGAGSKT